MGFSEIEDQDPAIQTLIRALQSGRVHHAYRFEGPRGVGKQMAAFALAQSLVCEGPEALACGRCSACKRAVTLSTEEPHVPVHPDVVLIQRGLYSQSVIEASEATSISVQQVRRIVLDRAAFPPHEGRALVFIVRDADELTVQAANALLKTLEEPGPRTHFVLLTSRPNRLLDTVRSRTLAVRFGPLSERLVARILQDNGLPATLAPLAGGSAALALELGSEQTLLERQQFVRAATEAMCAEDLTAAIAFAESRPSARDELGEQLGFLAQSFAVTGREVVATSPPEADLAARRHRVVLEAMRQVEANVNPALVLESMVARLRRA